MFRRQFTEMGPKRPHFVILTSTRDNALEMSSWLSGGVNRVTFLRPPLRQRLRANPTVSSSQDRRSRSLVRDVQDVSARLAMNGVGVMALKAASVTGIGHFVRADDCLSKPDE